MHELGIIFHIIDEVEKVATANKVESVKKVILEVGEVSTIVPDYFRDCWKWAVERTPHMKGCVLEMVIIAAGSYCQSCGKTYSTTKYAKVCPYCGSSDTYLYTGKDVVIKSIEAV